jgi:hypothetical protein
MATVIEPGVIGSDAIRRVATLIRVDEDLVLGKLVRLWTVSQKAERVSATRDEIAFWLRAGSEWIEALADGLAGFLKPLKDEWFEIAGNRRHIAKIRALKKASTIGGQSTRKKWQSNKPVETQPHDARPNGLADATPNATPTPGPKLNQAKLNQAKPKYSSEFEEIYKAYPRQEGKTPGHKTYLKSIKTEEDRKALLVAIRNYARAKAGKDKQYLLMFSTFMNQWTDWLPAEHGGSAPATPKLKGLEDIKAVNKEAGVA